MNPVQLELGRPLTAPTHPFSDLGLERCEHADSNPDCGRVGTWDWERGEVCCETCREQT